MNNCSLLALHNTHTHTNAHPVRDTEYLLTLLIGGLSIVMSRQ